METYDIVVIGAGPGGYPAAIRSAQLGAKVAIVEREALGGTCLNWGCIPTKTLLASADLFGRMKDADAMGLQAGTIGFDYAALAKRKDQVVAKLQGGVEALLKGNGVKLLHGTASFESRNRIVVSSGRGGSKETIEAGKTIIATGSTSAMPGFLPKHDRVLESRAFLDRKAAPRSVIVLGGGVIGCEFACLLATLGVKVTVVELLEDILFMLDADVRKVLRKHLETDLGARILTGKPLEKIQATAKAVKGAFGDETVEAELLLCAIGRKPVTDGLKLDRAGLQTDEKGYLPVDPFGQTSVATIYAIGDVTGGPQLAHAATAQGIVAAEHACGKATRPNEAVIPACIFTSPEIGQAGFSEEEASKAGKSVRVGKFPFMSLGKAMAAGETAGFAKWIADSETGQLLGAAVVGAHATELIAEASTAIRAELTLHEIGRTVHAHPTLSEAWMEAAHAAHGEAIHAAPRRRPKA